MLTGGSTPWIDDGVMDGYTARHTATRSPTSTTSGTRASATSMRRSPSSPGSPPSRRAGAGARRRHGPAGGSAGGPRRSRCGRRQRARRCSTSSPRTIRSGRSRRAWATWSTTNQPVRSTSSFVAYNTFFNLLTAERQQACFAAVAERLAPGGAFVIEAFVPGAARRVVGRRALDDRRLGRAQRHDTPRATRPPRDSSSRSASRVACGCGRGRSATPTVEQLDAMAATSGLPPGRAMGGRRTRAVHRRQSTSRQRCIAQFSGRRINRPSVQSMLNVLS